MQQENTNQSEKQPKAILLFGLLLTVMNSVNTVIDFPEKVNNLPKTYTEYVKLGQSFKQQGESLIEQIKTFFQAQDMEQPSPTETIKLASQVSYMGSELASKYRQAQQQSILERANSTVNPEQLAVEAELEKHIANLENELRNLEVIGNRINASKQATVWLEDKTSQKALAKEAVDFVLENDAALKNNGVGAETSDIEQFNRDIQGYLYLISTCLDMCRTNPLDKVLAEKRIPLSPLPASAYVTALTFIRDKRRVPDILSAEADSELKYYFNYLINALS